MVKRVSPVDEDISKSLEEAIQYVEEAIRLYTKKVVY